ncbi:MAG: FKBP-type peptidyl-prolyl cis-trans isomerase [Candidatus Nanoarchaeia archaeon]
MAFAIKGDTVKVDYITMLDGKVIATSVKSFAKEAGESSNNYEPLVFSIGEGKVVRGFEDALIGMRQGEEKTIAVEPHAGYGIYRSELVRKYPRALFEHTGINLEKGMALKINTSKGNLRGIVSALDDNDVLLDMNHEFAGKILIFKIILREIVR